ncbi:MAG: dihydroorotate dehydrogenase (quinone) [bacterium]|nr:dihydroorotate dehydrogenase (quinone) [bacterium]MDZ4296512.1 dihydroorotate dehydrogenase (quinone) [Patescibacteria group bacterium]
MSVISQAYQWYVERKFPDVDENAEPAAEWGLQWLEHIQRDPFLERVAERFLSYRHPMLETFFCGMHFPHPLGWAAGLDKYLRVYWKGLPLCGFSFGEVGGVTAHEQPGNQGVRLRAHRGLRATWNWYGFNNHGADNSAAIAARSPEPPVPVWLNIGKSADVPFRGEDDLPAVVADYRYTIRKVGRYFLAVVENPSSPNTVNLRLLQKKVYLDVLVRETQEEMRLLPPLLGGKRRKLGVKFAPDMNDNEVADAIDVCKNRQVDFVVLTNTTTDRSSVPGWNIPSDRGGVAGAPLRERALEVQKAFARGLGKSIPIAAAGAIMNGDDLYERTVYGATLSQTYAGLIFHGPDFVKYCLKRLVQRLKRAGFARIADAVGAAL